MKKAVHPTGFMPFGKVNIASQISMRITSTAAGVAGYDGDTTSFYISKRLTKFNLKITTISRGIPIGGEIEYADEITLGKSISSRINYKLEQ